MWVEFELNSSMGEGFSVLLMQRDGRKKGVGRYWSERRFFVWGRGVYIEGEKGVGLRGRGQQGVSGENKKGKEKRCTWR